MTLPDPGVTTPPTDEQDGPRFLTWNDLCDMPTTTDLLGETRYRMRDIWLAGVKAVVVPTRMHEPGWYVRSDNADNYWNIRDEHGFVMLRAMCDAGAVTAR